MRVRPDLFITFLWRAFGLNASRNRLWGDPVRGLHEETHANRTMTIFIIFIRPTSAVGSTITALASGSTIKRRRIEFCKNSRQLGRHDTWYALHYIQPLGKIGPVKMQQSKVELFLCTWKGWYHNSFAAPHSIIVLSFSSGLAKRK